MSDWRIPFNRATFAGGELELMRRAVEEGTIAGDGPYTRRCEDVLAEVVGAERALLTTSCTHALELAALLLELGPGDEVVVPSFTFVSTAAAFALRGARPVFGDVRPDTLNLDEAALEELVGERTRAIVPVHYGGVACELDAILELAAGVGATVVEDNAHGLFGAYRGRPLGSFGALATQSFHETKNVTCGEGGALIVNEPRYVAEAEVIREKGTNRKQFFRGEVDRYTWVALGSSYVQSDLLAAFLAAQLDARERIQDARRRIWHAYEEGLADWAAERGVRLPVVPEGCEQAYHLFYLLLPSLDARTRLIARLRERGILAVFHYLPLHLSGMGLRYGGREGQCPVTEDVADRLLRLPFYTALTGSEQAEVIEVVRGSTADGYDPGLFEALAAVEPESFWFRARNRLIVSTVRRHFPAGRSLLELGCGTGFVLAALREALPGWRLVGSELFDEGLTVARRRLPELELLQLDARRLPYREEFDVIGAFDLLEHVEEDAAVLAAARDAVRPGGGVVLLVPQHPRLWSAMDDVAHHVRRYTRRDLVAKVEGAGFAVERATSFVSALLPAMVVSRAVRRVSSRPYDPVAELRPGALNGVFERILDGERRLIERGVSLPAGGSLLVVGRRL